MPTPSTSNGRLVVGSGLIIEAVTVRHYGAIEEASLEFGGLTYLVGRNGAGKSTFLNALGAFFGEIPVTGEADFYAIVAAVERDLIDPPSPTVK